MSDFYRNCGKRSLDILISLAVILTALPILAILALLVRWRMGSPAIFSQKRPGLGATKFTMYKFRTMAESRASSGELLSDHERVTAFGALLRKTSLDELPEFWNVLKGDMSLVGPRPLLMRYLPYFTEREKLRFTVRPGITGLAQIRGRNSLGWNERLFYDVKYVEECSLWLDLRILAETVYRVLRRGDVVVVPNLVMADLDVERSEEKRDAHI